MGVAEHGQVFLRDLRDPGLSFDGRQSLKAGRIELQILTEILWHHEFLLLHGQGVRLDFSIGFDERQVLHVFHLRVTQPTRVQVIARADFWILCSVVGVLHTVCLRRDWD